MLEIRIREPLAVEQAAFAATGAAERPTELGPISDRRGGVFALVVACGGLGWAVTYSLIAPAFEASESAVRIASACVALVGAVVGAVIARKYVPAQARRPRAKPVGPTVATIRVEASRIALVPDAPEVGRAYAFQVADGAFVYAAGAWMSDASRFNGGAESMARFPSREFTLVVTRDYREVIRVVVDGERATPDVEIAGDRVNVFPVMDVDVVRGRVEDLTDDDAPLDPIVKGTLRAATVDELLAAAR